MKILIITENFKTGGLETQIMGFCRYLKSSGHEVHLISGIGSRTFPLREIIGDNILEVDMRPDLSTKEAMESINRISAYVQEKGADFLHLHPFTSFIYGGIAASLTNKPYVVTLHGLRSLPYGYHATYHIFIELILRDAWRIFCVSKEITEKIKAIIPECNVKTLPNGVDTERFKPTPRDPSGPIALISRMDADKIEGIKSFLGEWSKLPGDLRRPVHTFGEGNSFEELKKWVNDSFKGESWITLMGHEDRIDERLRTGYSAVAGMGRVVIEAGAMNLPVILIGYEGPNGFVSLENCAHLFQRNFSGRYAPIIGIEKIQEELGALDILPERFLLSSWVLKNVDEKDILKKYLEQVENIKPADYKWNEPFLSSIEETEDTPLFGDKVFHCLFDTLPQNHSNYHWVSLYLSDKINRAIADKNTLGSQLNQIIAEKEALAGQLAQVASEKEGQARQLAQTIAEKDVLRDQLNNIYLSNFWKIANLYYKMKDRSMVLRCIHNVLRGANRKQITNLYIRNIPKFFAYAKRSGFRQALRRSYERVKTPTNPFPHTYVKIELDEALRRRKENQGIVIYPPTVDWNHTLFQRPHHIMLGLARKGFTTFFCTPNQIDSLKWDLGSLEENLFLCSNPDALLNLSGRSDLILYISNTMHKPLIEKLRPAKVIYDYIDELEVFSNYDAEMVITHEELVKNADIVLVTAERLFQKVQQIREDAILCPNAVDYWHFAHAQLNGPRPFDFKQRGLTSRPIIGYYGALAEWIDYDLLAKAARKRPNYDFVLIGLDYDGSLFKSSAMTMPNVHYFGPKKYVELPQYLRYFDVAIIPFKLNKITHSTSPLKLFEYISALKPVVTTAMDELKKYSYIFLAHDSDEFVNLLDKALSLKTDLTYLESLRQEALQHTWDRRVNTIIRRIKQPHFQRALTEHMNKKVSANHPMRDIYLEFASSTVERGDDVAKIIRNHFKIEGKKYLDVGSAYGGFLIAFAKAGASEVIGVDIDSNLISLAIELLRDYDCPVQPKLFVMDILQANEQVSLGKFDIITCNDVIEHVASPELLVKKLSTLLNRGGILYLEIPNAFNPRMAIRDGHYGLFGITLLDRANSLLYFEHNFENQSYSVGEYLDLSGYLKLFKSYGFETTLLNGIYENEEELNQIARIIQTIPSAYQNAIKAVPDLLRDYMQKAISGYMDKFSKTYEDFLNGRGEERKSKARQIYYDYGIEFWRFLLKRIE